jgi:PTS system fructose-specific IIA component/PTS system nitrogen regulatory IIA component
MEPGHGFPVYSILACEVLTKEQAIRAVVERLVADRQLAASCWEEVVWKLLKRERLGSTGIGQGVAIPHAMFDKIKQLVGALATFPGGVDFDSIDGKPVHTAFLLVSPWDRPGDHLRALEKAARYLRDK